MEWITNEALMNPIILSLICAALVLGPQVAHAKTLQLTEERVMVMALDQNLDVKIAHADSEISKTGIMQSKSRFDTFAHFDVNHRIDKNDQAIPVFGTNNKTTNWNLGLSKVLPTGTETSFEWQNQRESTNSAFAAINPSFESALVFQIRQPLLQNVIGVLDRGAVKIAKKNYESADDFAQRQISVAVFQVLGHYWRWMADRVIVNVTERSYVEAKKFEKISEQKQEFGLHESTDVLDAKAQSLRILNALRLDKTQRDNTLGRLQHSLNLDDTIEVRSNEKIIFTTERPHLPQAITQALEKRSDYLSVKSRLAANRIQVSLSKNQLWPELDLVASLDINGVAGAYRTATSEASSAANPAWYIGGSFLYPLENRQARSGRDRAQIEKVRSLYELKNLENQITQNVEEEWRNVITSINVVQTNRRIETLQRNKWQEELKKYRTGRSSSDIVTRFQEDYLVAERNTINSLYDHRIAVLGLRLAQNTLIQ